MKVIKKVDKETSDVEEQINILRLPEDQQVTLNWGGNELIVKGAEWNKLMDLALKGYRMGPKEVKGA